MRQSSLHITSAATQVIIDSSAVKETILKTLCYFDIFHYPLTGEEIRQFSGKVVEEKLFRQMLKQLETEKNIYYFNGLYSLQNNPLLAVRRRNGNENAKQLLIRAVDTGRFLYKFPFVRAIGISGSLSKNYADEKADIDFFIIAKAGRLWIARTFMHLYKKLTFLTGKQHFYCMNYYVDEKALLLEDQNIFTAIEIKTLLPVSGEHTMQQFFDTNKWANDWLPACSFRAQYQKDDKIPRSKKFIEWLFNGSMGTRIENYLFGVTERRWKRKEAKGKCNEKGQTMGLITGKHFAKSNPGAFQEKILASYEHKISGLSDSSCHEDFTFSSAK